VSFPDTLLALFASPILEVPLGKRCRSSHAEAGPLQRRILEQALRFALS
jgi:hypothetical protein